MAAEQGSEISDLEKARAFFAPLYKLEAAAPWDKIAKAETAKIALATRYKVADATFAYVAVPEHIEFYLFKFLWQALDSIFPLDSFPELNVALKGLENSTSKKTAMLNFSALRAKILELYGEGATLNVVMARSQRDILNKEKALYGLDVSASRDDLILARTRYYCDEPETEFFRDSDLGEYVSASIIEKWRIIKTLEPLMDQVPEESPLWCFKEFINFFLNTYSLNLSDPLTNNALEAKRKELIDKLEKTPWEVIDAEEDRDRRNRFTLTWPIERNASWQTILETFEGCYEELRRGRQHVDIEHVHVDHNEVLAVQQRMRQLLADQLARKEGGTLLSLFQVAARQTV